MEAVYAHHEEFVLAEPFISSINCFCCALGGVTSGLVQVQTHLNKRASGPGLAAGPNSVLCSDCTTKIIDLFQVLYSS